MVGRSGDANDGNAPILEPCEDCDRGAPVDRDERALIELALSEYGKATGKHVLPGGINENQDGFVHGFLVRAALERKPS
ncbi:hypothetical protein CXG53_25970 [Pseudomonas guariconensis]|uniref:Uncharacterized protein n=2 Tax=Pseudomonas guariconensis TaxID=1288410 RepID=A0AAX0VNU8_9PSED|nr:hypothetical protein CXG49_25980 [Pseudomonas guariconensis]PLV20263.1 hypothetical protein CXG53_25970 [Pseudomonas guariconensis]PLV26405.1 hypothetical protein CXG51_25970 [Pseudomonas guariconensis]